MVAQVENSTADELLRCWEKAYLARSYDAAVGRLFRGITHNLNGVMQVASFYGDVSRLALERAADLLAQVKAAETPAQAAGPLGELAVVLEEQQKGLTQFKERIGQGAEILRRALTMPALPAEGPQPRGWNLNDVVRCEDEFLCADTFYKHKLERKLELAPELPALVGDLVVVHEVVHILLKNALEAVREGERASLVILTLTDGEMVELVVRDSGPGVPGEQRDQIFAPFFTTRSNHQGLGLYLARKLVRGCGGELLCLDGPGGAFKLRLPFAATDAGRLTAAGDGGRDA
ncbi:sensor histidine kinase [Desulfurivibrio alkaliphilus]|uniref:histidine kinase n=1 Tax=Desulfurivibrio alkaliphilus (strain DSM 19089 / UNIQEM U267 / AHT2) TaxID=589865 RepID=D6Z2Y4_DESAT|nr:ATP-binding protein [Desulfurivibrio alkaliphilus]ADH85909.1 histidine kinase [Desulfurivibrio alkaliphilus AHT 2]